MLDDLEWMADEQRACNECGEQWTDDGSYLCPFCGSDDTHIMEDNEDPE